MKNESEKRKKYEEVLSKIEKVLEREKDYILMMATISALLKSQFDYFSWVGFYIRTAEKMLSVGPYQGEWGCLHIPFERGVCGACARTEETVIVPDVTKFPGHIACDGKTKSEIVVPVFDSGKKLIAVLDIDSHEPAAFNGIDKAYLEEIAKIFQRK